MWSVQYLLRVLSPAGGLWGTVPWDIPQEPWHEVMAGDLFPPLAIYTEI